MKLTIEISLPGNSYTMQERLEISRQCGILQHIFSVNPVIEKNPKPGQKYVEGSIFDPLHRKIGNWRFDYFEE